jgi:F-type H+-transporting ATPase subunit delta
MMQGEVLGRRYAKALFELTKDDQNRTAIGALLADLGVALGHPGALADACFNPQYPTEAKRAVLAEAVRRAGAGSLAVSFLDLLLKKNRLRFLPAIAGAYQALLDEGAGRQRVSVATAHPLSPDDEGALRRRLEATTKRTVVLDLHVDPDLIGGLVIRWGSLYYDGSLKGQLERLHQRLSTA